MAELTLPKIYEWLTPQERRQIREYYIFLQEGLCFWCKNPLEGPPTSEVQDKKIDWRLFPCNFQNHPIHLQHDRRTGYTEGAVHMLCNAVMWQYHGR